MSCDWILDTPIWVICKLICGLVPIRNTCMSYVYTYINVYMYIVVDTLTPCQIQSTPDLIVLFDRVFETHANALAVFPKQCMPIHILYIFMYMCMYVYLCLLCHISSFFVCAAGCAAGCEGAALLAPRARQKGEMIDFTRGDGHEPSENHPKTIGKW